MVTIKVIRVSSVKMKNFSRFIELILIKEVGIKNLVTLWKLHHSALFHPNFKCPIFEYGYYASMPELFKDLLAAEILLYTV